MTRQQESTIDRLALEHGRVAVDEGFADGTVSATVPDGAEFRIHPNGVGRYAGVNFSTSWGYDA